MSTTTTKFPIGRVVALVAAAWALKTTSRSIELAGDVQLERTDRLPYHLTALVLLIAALACGLLAARALWRYYSAPKPPRIAKVEQPLDEDERSDFDADAALARYMERRDQTPAGPASPTTTAHPGFGRRGL